MVSQFRLSGNFLNLLAMDFTRKLSVLVLLLCVLISLMNQNAERGDRRNSFPREDCSVSDSPSLLAASSLERSNELHESLSYDYYRESCPLAERIIRSTVHELYGLRPNATPALLRLVFHDCFVEGCDASVLLDSDDGIESEKDSPPNESLRGFDLIDTIKAKVEATCPGVVSCADIIALAARESVILAGGPFYPLLTGRKDSTVSFSDIATSELPSPHDDLSKTIDSFASRGFDERETVSLLGAHSTGTIHCKFFLDRLYDFGRSNGPDPSIDPEFLKLLRSKCSSNQLSLAPAASPSLPPSPASSDKRFQTALFEDPAMQMDYEGLRAGFGTVYYRSLLQGKGLLLVDQQLTAGEETAAWVRAFASDISLFQREFGHAMIKLSNLRVLTTPMGQVRINCRKVN